MINNLFSQLPAQPPEQEQFLTLLQQPGLHIERIVSFGHASPADFWYQQPQAEWVLLLSGSAQLRFADDAQARSLQPGDFVQIAAQRRHRVDATASDQASVWLAIHYREETQ
ncbi:MAG: cupin domain-containing protein [Burkholderiales bacterium]